MHLQVSNVRKVMQPMTNLLPKPPNGWKNAPIYKRASLTLFTLRDFNFKIHQIPSSNKEHSSPKALIPNLFI